MKQRIAFAVLAVALLAAGGGCRTNQVTEEEAVEAFAVAFLGYSTAFSAVFLASTPDGVVHDAATGTMTFQNYDLTAIQGETSYSAMSGTIALSASEELTGDLTLQGGVVQDLTFTMDVSTGTGAGASITIVANGTEFVLTDYAP